MKTNRILPSAFAALLAATALFAANENSGGSGAVAAADKNFMVAAAEGGMLEVRLGEIAQKGREAGCEGVWGYDGSRSWESR